MTNILFQDFLNACERSVLFLEKKEERLSFFERFFRSIGSCFGLCESSAQKCFGINIQALNQKLKQLDPEALKTHHFALNFYRNLAETKERWAPLAASPIAKRSLNEIVTLVTSISKEALHVQRCEEAVKHYENITIQGNPGMKLNAYPKKCEKSVPITKEQKDEFLTAFRASSISKTPGAVSIVQTAINSVQQLTQKQLDTELEKCVMVLNERLRELGMPSYAAAVAEKKSSQWCMELATPYLDYLPSSGLSISNGGVAKGIGNTDSKTGRFSELKEEVLVLFEDCSYSGAQLDYYFQEFIGRARAEKPLKIFVVVPFISESALKVLQDNIATRAKKKKNVVIEIITSKTRIKSLKDVFPDERDLNLFHAIHPGNALHLAICDWRFPDPASFCPSLGIVLQRDSSVRPPKFTTEDFLEPQRNVVVPYK